MADDLPAWATTKPVAAPPSDMPAWAKAPQAAAPAADDMPAWAKQPAAPVSPFTPNARAALAGKSPVRHQDPSWIGQANAMPLPDAAVSGDKPAQPDTGTLAPERKVWEMLKADPGGTLKKLGYATVEEAKQALAPLGVFGDVAQGKASMSDPATQERVMGSAMLTGMREAPGGVKGMAAAESRIEQPAVKPPGKPAIPGENHPDLRAAGAAGQDGFVTSTGQFVNRSEGSEIAKRAGQAQPGTPDNLHTEDLQNTPKARPVGQTAHAPNVATDMPAWAKAPDVQPPMERRSLSGAATPTAEILKTIQAAAPEAKPMSLKEAADTVNKTLRGVFAPHTVDEAAGRAAGGIREAVGVGERASAQTAAALEGYRGFIKSLDTQSRLNVLDYMETRTARRAMKGDYDTIEIGGRNMPVDDPILKGVLDTFRNEMTDRQAQLQAMPKHAQMSFIDDYVRHFWKDPSAAKKFFSGSSGKTGSTKSLKKRSIPTIADGIRAGLEPITTDPIEIGVRYVESIDRYIGMRNYFEDARKQGDVKYFMPGKAPDGWTKLDASFAPKGMVQEPYAPDGFARVWNNFVRPGINDTAFKSLYTGWMALKSMNTTMALGLSGFHATTMTLESMVSDVAKAVGQTLHGDIGAVGTAATAPFAPVKQVMKGRRALEVYRGQLQGSPVEQQIVDLLSRANMRMSGKGRVADEYRYSGAGSYVDALRKGTLKAELLTDAKGAMRAPITGAPKAVFKNIGRAFETVSQPLFEYYVPRLKLGAAYDTMATWLRQNPEAKPSEQLAAARRIADSIDNRFGEVNQTNNFMNPIMKQALQGVLLSWSWTKGTLSEIGGAPMDVLKHGTDSTKGAYVVALALTMPIVNTIYQIAHGQPSPWDTDTPIRDAYFPRTGGKNKDGSPERAVMPGYVKDVFGWAEHPVQEAWNKQAPILQTIEAAISGKGWVEDKQGKSKYGPIAPRGATWPEWLTAYVRFIARSFEPISVEMQTEQQNPKSRIGAAEKGFGLRPAGTAVANPERQKAIDDWLKYGPQKRPKYGGF